MDLTNETFAPLRVMIDEFARAGIEHAVVAPGSRNAPIAYALGDREEIKCWSVLDERQAGFFALGIAKSSGKPVIVTCTSGTAAANLHPAVIEADHAGVPLIVLTADRPPELRAVGAGQAIDQIKVYGDSVRWFLEAGNHPLSDQTLRHFRAQSARACAAATGANPGPVHINLPLREPLRPTPSDLGELGNSPGATGREGGAPWTAYPPGDPFTDDLLGRLEASRRPVFVVGEQIQPGLAAAIAELSGISGAPVLADALSQLRRKGFSSEAHIVAAYDLILRSQPAANSLRPDLVVRIGQTPTSKPLRNWLSGLECPQIVLDPRGRLEDPTQVAAEFWRGDPLATVSTAADRADGQNAARGWTTAWQTIERAAQSAIDQQLAAAPFPFEPAVYRSVISSLEAGATIYTSSSMPIRDVESYGPIGRDDLRYLASRGTNGIDGVVSSALGVSAPFDCDRVILMTGDLALLYDASALAIAARYELPLTIICVDNAGGGIFSFLPIAEHESHFEQLVATPPGTDIEAVVRAYGMPYSAPRDNAGLIEAAARPGFIHLRTDRAENKAEHDRIAAHVVDSVGAALTDTGAFH